MFEKDIKKCYDGVSPSEETKKTLIAKVRAQRKRQALSMFVFECVGSAAACFLLALGVNYMNTGNKVPSQTGLLATVMSKPNGYVIAGIVLFILLAVFTTLFIKRMNREK